MANWTAFETALNFRLPKLKRPSWMQHVITGITVNLFFAFLILMIFHSNWWFFSFFLLPIIAKFLYFITKKYAVELPEKDLKALTFEILRLNAAKLKLSEQEVYSILQNIIHSKLGVPINQISLDASFTNDLGMD